jgi:EmrB/QacA subfamily drug resistance transporter
MRSHATTLLICSVAQFMVVLDVTIVNVALPQVQADLGLSTAGQQWVVNAYTLTFGGFLLVGGRAADVFGRRRVFVLGLAVFTVCSLLGGLAQSGGQIISARAAQGIGSAMLAPATLSLLTSTFTDGHERRSALGVWSATAAAGAAAGVLLGGVLTDVLSWRWVLLVNVPVGVALMAGATAALGGTPALTQRRELDLAGAFTVTAGLATLIYGIVGTHTHAWGSARTLATFAGAAILLAAFVLIEARFAADPVIPLGFLRRRSIAAASTIGVIVGMAVFGTYFFVSLYLQRVAGHSPLEAGVMFLPVGLSTLLGALAAPRVVRRVDVRRTLVTALLVTSSGLFWLAHVDAGSSYAASLLGPLAIIGVGFGLTFVPMTLAATAEIPPHQAGLASGLTNTSRQVGGAVGLAALVAVAGHDAPTTAAALSAGYDRAFLVMAAGSVLAATAALRLPRPT